MKQKTPHYNKYCWNIGTTSFRTKDFNRSIETQLLLLKNFWELPGNADAKWTSSKTQELYYSFLKTNGFLTGDASHREKDARQKASGLKDLGLLTSSSRLSEAGHALRAIADSGDFSSDNVLQIDSDSYIYLRQLLKLGCEVGDSIVRPLPIVLRALLNPVFDSYITNEEFTYILPLITSEGQWKTIVEMIPGLRNGTITADDIILGVILDMPNYREAKRLFLDREVTEDSVVQAGMNRKSRDKCRYDKDYYPFYVLLRRLVLDRDSSAAHGLLAAIRNLKLHTQWRRALFGDARPKEIEASPLKSLRPTALTRADNDSEFRTAFFDMMHLLKARHLLADYMDLNRRYLSLADILLFQDGRITLDVVPERFFRLTGDALADISFTTDPGLNRNCPIEDIHPSFAVGVDELVAEFRKTIDPGIDSLDQVLDEVDKDRYRRLHDLIAERFTDDALIELFKDIDVRNDKRIRNKVTDNADVPTIFEYLVGIAWYKLSGLKGRLLDYMRLSLDANLLPKSHAAGGGADIVYEYGKTQVYPAHKLLLEATLTDNVNQRRMEMEPVSRHLGDEIIAGGNPHTYCVFIAPHLDPNVISDFRSRKHMLYYERAANPRHINGMKIIPLSTADLREAIAGHRAYASLYGRFEAAHDDDSDIDPLNWYKTMIALC